MNFSKFVEALRIDLLEVECIKEYWTDVFDPFLQNRHKGLGFATDQYCNSKIKFGALFDKVFSSDFDRDCEEKFLVKVVIRSIITVNTCRYLVKFYHVKFYLVKFIFLSLGILDERTYEIRKHFCWPSNPGIRPIREWTLRAE